MTPSSRASWIDLLDHAARDLRAAAGMANPLLPASPTALDAVTPFWLHRGVLRPPSLRPPENPAPDAALWWRLAGAATLSAPALLDAADPSLESPLLPRDAYDTVEVWTEGELCALHASWWLALRNRRPAWRTRIVAALRWHLQHTQPDNATNRPWCVAPFLNLALEDSDPDALAYAQTLLHNARAGPPRASLLFAELIADAADALRADDATPR